MCCVDRFKHPGDLDGAPISKGNNEVPIFTIIKFQAIARGFIARNRVKKTYGFSRSPGVLMKTDGKLSAEELEA